MLFLYSGITDDFGANMKHFAQGLVASSRVALLIQGGDGYEKFLGTYFGPLNDCGIESIDVIFPEKGTCALSGESIGKIRDADAVFIGGGATAKYAATYCIDPVRRLLAEKHMSGLHVGGLSAGSIIMNDFVLDLETGLQSAGIGLVGDMHVLPHFDEDRRAHEAIRYALDHPATVLYGFDNDAVLVVDEHGNRELRGTGSVYRICVETNGTLTIVENPFSEQARQFPASDTTFPDAR